VLTPVFKFAQHGKYLDESFRQHIFRFISIFYIPQAKPCHGRDVPLIEELLAIRVSPQAQPDKLLNFQCLYAFNDIMRVTVKTLHGR
jgi:hypothetical protein